MNTRLAVELACVLEATARKPGNAHRDRDLPALRYLELVASGIAVGPYLAQATEIGIGAAILESVKATSAVAASNTNLGILLLLAPLAALADQQLPLEEMARVLDPLTMEDARQTYEAIRLANPGGMSKVDAQDVHSEPTIGLVEAMRLAAGRDRVAAQYANGFTDVRDFGVPLLLKAVAGGATLEDAILWNHLQWMAHFPDTLIARKRGAPEAEESAKRATEVLEHFPVGPYGMARSLIHPGPMADLDAWLTAEGQERNPGTTADLVTACLFWGLRTGRIDPKGQSFQSGS